MRMPPIRKPESTKKRLTPAHPACETVRMQVAAGDDPVGTKQCTATTIRMATPLNPSSGGKCPGDTGGESADDAAGWPGQLVARVAEGEELMGKKVRKTG